MNKHEVWEKVRDHLLKQGKVSRVSPEDICAYRGEGGLSCAVGCLIADEHYNPKFEGIAVAPYTETNHPELLTERDVLLREALRKSGIDVDDPGTLSLLRELQGIHDCKPVWQWEQELAACEP